MQLTSKWTELIVLYFAFWENTKLGITVRTLEGLVNVVGPLERGERYGLHASAGARTKGTAQWRRRHLLIVCCLQCVSGRLTCRHRLLLLLRTCHCDTSRRVSKSNEVKCPSLSVPLSLSSVYVSARWLRQLRVPTTCAKKRGERLQEESITEWLIMLSNKLHSRSSTSILSSYSFPANAAGLQSLVPSAHLLTIVITFLLRWKNF